MIAIATTSDNTQRTISSLEIAELTGKHHDHVMRGIRTMLTELGITDPIFGGSYEDSTGRTLPCFNLPPREVKILITGYDVVRRAKVIDRLEQLERGLIPQDLPTALRAYADAEEKRLLLEQKVAEQAPKVLLAEAVMASNDEMSLTKAGKHFGFTSAEFIKLLANAGSIFKRVYHDGRSDFWEPSTHMIKSGYMKLSQVLCNDRRYHPQTVITSKGLDFCNQLVLATRR